MTKEMGDKDQGIEVSLHSIAGLTSPKTMRLRSFIKTQEVITLIDPGATHNFIFSALVEKMKLTITDTAEYGVAMGMRDKVSGHGVCKGITLQLQGVDV